MPSRAVKKAFEICDSRSSPERVQQPVSLCKPHKNLIGFLFLFTCHICQFLDSTSVYWCPPYVAQFSFILYFLVLVLFFLNVGSAYFSAFTSASFVLFKWALMSYIYIEWDSIACGQEEEEFCCMRYGFLPLLFSISVETCFSPCTQYKCVKKRRVQW